MERRRLGRTGVEVSILGLGGGRLGLSQLSIADAVNLIHRALEHDINYVDTSPGYGDGGSEERIGLAVRGRRDRVFLATKVDQRSRAEATTEIEGSLRRLGVEYLDLLQIHAVNDDATLDQVLGRDGALAAARAHQAEGRVRFVGITGHRSPEVLLRALQEHDFDTVLMPINPADRQLHDFGAVVLPLALKRDVGVVAMKVYGHGLLRHLGPICLRYALSQPVSAAIVGMSSLDELNENVQVAGGSVHLTAAEDAELMRATRPLAFASELWWRAPERSRQPARAR